MIENLIKRLPKLEPNKKNIELAIEEIIKCYEKGGKVLIAGNGGSACDSEHIAGELLKSFLKKRPIKEDLRKELLKISPLSPKPNNC